MQTLWVCFGKTTTLGANSQALAKKAARRHEEWLLSNSDRNGT